MLKRAYEAVAKGLREFGYPDVTAAMIQEAHAAWLAGKTAGQLPHGVIGQFAERDFEKRPDLFGTQRKPQ